MNLKNVYLFELEEALEKLGNQTDVYSIEFRVPDIFLELSRYKPILDTDESYLDREAKDLKSKHSCTVEGIQALSELANEGDTVALRVLSDYFKQHGEYHTEWTYKYKLQVKADIATKIRREERREKIEKENREKENKAEREKYGCIMPKGLMK